MSEPEPNRRAVQLRILGRVQGVWFRGWTADQAAALGIDGWVRNRHDGTVEVLAVGTREAVDKFIRACRRGPPAARVERVEIIPAQDLTAAGFIQKPTA